MGYPGSPAGCSHRCFSLERTFQHVSFISFIQAEPGATIPLAIVVLASGRVSGPVQGRAILETKGEISTVSRSVRPSLESILFRFAVFACGLLLGFLSGDVPAPWISVALWGASRH